MRICFFALNAYPTLAGTPETRVGGAEVQQILIARYLVKQGHEVSFVVGDHGQKDGEIINGIKIYKSFVQGAGLPFFRFIHPRCTGSLLALKRANADIYYQRCAGMETGLLALFCKLSGKKFVFASASDSDFEYSKIITSSSRDKYIYAYGLKRANKIITQTNNQKKLLRTNFNLDAKVISNSWDISEVIGDLSGENGYILWVSTLRSLKRPELFIDLAEAMPDIKFVMVGGAASGEQSVYDEAEARAIGLSNLDFKGFVPFENIGKYFDAAKIVINTSTIEGFPNAFLQAWQRSIPVVSYFDPDGIIKNEKVGFSVSSNSEMEAAVITLVSDKYLYSAYQKRAKEYFDNNHSIDVLGNHYEKIFRGL